MTEHGRGRWWSRAALGMGVVFVLGACGSGNNDGAPRAAATSSSTSSSSTSTSQATTTIATPSTDVVTTAVTRATAPTTPARPPAAQPPITTTGPVATRPGRTPVAGFGEVAFQVFGQGATRCALLASAPQQRQQGLMGRTDLAGYDGMLFVFPDDEESGFWMKDTPMPLSIAYFDANGNFVSSADMEPCMNRGNDCPVYRAAGPYRMALEVQQGGLSGLGIGAGAHLAAGGSCS